MSVIKYITSVPHFDELWGLTPDDPDMNTIAPEMIPLLPQEIELKYSDTVLLGMQLHPDRHYLLISGSRTISFSNDDVHKHTLGQDPLCWAMTELGGSIEQSKGMGPLFVLNDVDLFNLGIFCQNYILDEKLAIPSDQYVQLVRQRYNHQSQLGDMLHIPAYDFYSQDHFDVYRHLLIFDGEKFVRTTEGSDYGSVPPEETSFPQFSIEHFTPLGRSGDLLGGFRWIDENIIEQYNRASIHYQDSEDLVVKRLEIGDRNYFFMGDEEYLVEPMIVEVVEPSYAFTPPPDFPKDYLLLFCPHLI